MRTSLLKYVKLRSRFGLHSLSSCCVHDAFLPSMGLLLLHYDCLFGTGQSSETKFFLLGTFLARSQDTNKVRFAYIQIFQTSCFFLVQFVCVESLVTAMIDMYPSTFRRKNRRELFILVVALISFLMGLIMLTEVCF